MSAYENSSRKIGWYSTALMAISRPLFYPYPVVSPALELMKPGRQITCKNRRVGSIRTEPWWSETIHSRVFLNVV